MGKFSGKIKRYSESRFRFPRRYHPSSHSYALNSELIFCRQAKNNVSMDSANFQGLWTTFAISFYFPYSSTSENHKK